MDLESVFRAIDKNLLAVLVTTIVGFISWLVKGLVETPLINAREVFFKYFDRRIEILSDIKVRLSLISLFPDKESLDYKEQLQAILLTEGKAAYLSQDLFASILEITVNKQTNEMLVLETVKKVDSELKVNIDKVQQANKFYITYSNANPTKKILGYFVLGLTYMLILIVILGLAVSFIPFFINSSVFIQTLAIAITCVFIFIVKRILNND